MHLFNTQVVDDSASSTPPSVVVLRITRQRIGLTVTGQVKGHNGVLQADAQHGFFIQTTRARRVV
jgi:hypothetical protein